MGGNVLKEDLKFEITDQSFYEILLCEIRGQTIAYSARKTKENLNLQLKLEKKMEALEICLEEFQRRRFENDVALLLEEYKCVQMQLQVLREKKLYGSFIRSKARWVEYGEKPSKYFLSLEKRNFGNK